MGFRQWLGKWFGNRKEYDLESFCVGLDSKIFYKKLAINACVNLISNSLTRAKFRTYEKGEERKGENFYLFNVEPNINQNAAEFFHELISKLVYDNEALVVMQNKQLFIADDWTVDEKSLIENRYTDVVIKDYSLNKDFYEKDVFHFKLNDEKIINVINGLYEDYGKLISSSINYYKRANALRAILRLERSGPQTDEEQEALDDLFDVQLKSFFEAEGGAALPLQDGIGFEEVFQESGQTKSKDSRDIRSLIDDIFDFVSMAFHIPKGLLKGDLAEVDNQTNNFLMFCLAPIAELLEDEINRKYYSKKEYLERTYLKIDISMVKYVDPVEIATALEKWLSSGTHSVNENRSFMDLEPIDEEWANKHYITKNYAETEQYLKGGEGE